MSYYDVDSILTDSQKLPCTFELEVPGLGILEGNPGEDIKAGTRIDLPLWLGVMLSIGARLGTSRLVTLDLPSALSDRVVNALKADPRTVDLRSLAPHFYSLSERVLDLFEEEEMVDVLINVCINPHQTARSYRIPLRFSANLGLDRHSKSAQQKLLTTHITPRVLWGRVRIFFEGWMRRRGNCSAWPTIAQGRLESGQGRPKRDDRANLKMIVRS